MAGYRGACWMMEEEEDTGMLAMVVGVAWEVGGDITCCDAGGRGCCVSLYLGPGDFVRARLGGGGEPVNCFSRIDGV